MCFKSMGSNICTYQYHWKFSCHCKTSQGRCKKAQEERIFTAVLRAIGSVKLGTRGTGTIVPSFPKCSSPAPPLCNLILRRNDEDRQHPYFLKEFELHEHTQRYRHEHERLISYRRSRGKSQITPHRSFSWLLCLKSNRPIASSLILPKWTFDYKYLVLM